MEDYIKDLLSKVVHNKPIKSQLLPHLHTPIVYGSTKQFTVDTGTSAPLDAKGILRVKNIVGALLYYGCAVNNKLMVSLSAIGYQQESATMDTADAVGQLLDYVATYPHGGIIYRDSDMILAAHSDASYLNERLSRSRAGSHIFLSENDPLPTFNGPVLTIATIIKFVMSSSLESDMGTLFITAK